MKSILKKSLSLVLVGLFLLNSYFGFQHQCAFAIKPISSESESLKEDEFLGDNGKRYKLGERLGAGEECVVYKCTGEDGNGYVVKVRLSKEVTKEEVLNKLRESYESRSETDKSNSLPQGCTLEESFSRNRTTVVMPSTPVHPKTKARLTKEIDSDVSEHPLMKSFNYRVSDDDKSDVETSYDIPDSPSASVCRNLFDSLCDDVCVSPAKKPRVERSIAYDIVERSVDNPNDDEFLLDSIDSSLSKVEAPETVSMSGRVFSDQDVTRDSKRPIPTICESGVICSRAAEEYLKAGNKVPHLVEIFSFHPYIEKAYDYDLKKFIEKIGKPTEKQVQGWISDILDALMILHENNLCHRDIKPDNIFIDADGSAAVLGDLGTLCYTYEIINKKIGSVGYMAPEVWEGTQRQVSLCSKADVFSLGITVLELLTDFKAVPDDMKEEDCNERNKELDKQVDKMELSLGWKGFLKICLNHEPIARSTAADLKVWLDIHFSSTSLEDTVYTNESTDE